MRSFSGPSGSPLCSALLSSGYTWPFGFMGFSWRRLICSSLLGISMKRRRQWLSSLLHLLLVANIGIDVENDRYCNKRHDNPPETERGDKTARDANEAHRDKQPAAESVCSLPHHLICD